MTIFTALKTKKDGSRLNIMISLWLHDLFHLLNNNILFHFQKEMNWQRYFVTCDNNFIELDSAKHELMMMWHLFANSFKKKKMVKEKWNKNKIPYNITKMLPLSYPFVWMFFNNGFRSVLIRASIQTLPLYYTQLYMYRHKRYILNDTHLLCTMIKETFTIKLNH